MIDSERKRRLVRLTDVKEKKNKKKIAEELQLYIRQFVDTCKRRYVDPYRFFENGAYT